MKSAKRHTLPLILLLALSVMLTACSRGTGAASGETDRRLGVNGYVYVPEPLSSGLDPNSPNTYWLRDFRVANGYLYYTDNAIRRISLDGKPDFSANELVRVVNYMTGFTVDQDRNLYCYTTPKYADSFSTGAPSCITLTKYSSDGSLCFQLPLPEEQDSLLQSGAHSPIAVDGGGNVLLLTENGILKINETGSLTGKYTLEDSQVDSNIQKYLLQSDDGQVYYVAENYNNALRTVYSVAGGAVPEITMLSSLSGYFSDNLYNGPEGILIQAPDGTVSLFSSNGSPSDRGNSESASSMEEIFRFEDSDLVSRDVNNLVQLSQDSFLVSMSTTGDNYISVQELLLLTKTSLEDLPEKETIVLASLFPTDDLRQTVVEFNRASQQYHVSIESYGATHPWDDNEGAYLRLDSSLVSGNPPDILDLAEIDSGKYTENGALADLTPYMEQSGALRPEQYLDNLRAGYTIDQQLFCLPGSFYVFAVYGQDERTAEIKNWTMEEAMALTRENPHTRLLPGVWNDSSFMLQDFCAPWYLEKFIDWEQGSCNFQSTEFCVLLEWIKTQLALGSDYEGGILGSTYLYSFSDYWTTSMKLENAPALLGFPSVDGNGVFNVFVKDALCLTANSQHPKGAWAFLEYTMSRSEAGSLYDMGFPSRKAQLNALAAEMTSPSYRKDFEGNLITDEEGNYIQTEKWTSYINGEPVPCYVMEQSHVDAVKNMIDSLDFTPRSAVEDSIVKIVTEEADFYFNDSKTAEEAAEIIQNRVQNLIQENR